MHEALGMWVIRSDKELIVTGELNYVFEHPLLRIAANPNVASEVFSQWPLHLRGVAHIAIAIIYSFQPFPNPSDHRLDRSDTEPREAFENAVHYHRGQSLARILDKIHREIHQSRFRLM